MVAMERNSESCRTSIRSSRRRGREQSLVLAVATTMELFMMEQDMEKSWIKWHAANDVFLSHLSIWEC